LSALLLVSCGTEAAIVASPTPTPTAISVPSPAPTPTASPTPRATRSAIVPVRYRVDVRAEGGDDFASTLASVMSDRRGWRRAGFDIAESDDATYHVVLAEGDEVDRLCKPYDTGGEFSCQNGPVVAINAERWRDGVDHWPGDLNSYRTMLLNHEMGHLLGQRHRDCPGAGQVAPVMQQQSGGLDGCTANAWPLDDEIARAARHDLKLAPAFGE
jgi:hypothetical protein